MAPHAGALFLHKSIPGQSPRHFGDSLQNASGATTSVIVCSAPAARWSHGHEALAFLCDARKLPPLLEPDSPTFVVPAGQSVEHPMDKQNRPSRPDRPRSQPVGNYNPGGQAGQSVQSGGQRPVDAPGAPFLGRGSNSRANRNHDSKVTAKPEGKSKTSSDR